MTERSARASAGRVGRPHGLDGSFYVEDASESLAAGTPVTVGGRATVIERRAGTDHRPLVRLRDICDRDAALALRGASLEVAGGALEPGEYLSADLIGCRIDGLGTVRRVVPAPSCDLLEVGDEGELVPFISDAVKHVDLEAGRIDVDRRFLGLDDEGGEDVS